MRLRRADVPARPRRRRGCTRRRCARSCRSRASRRRSAAASCPRLAGCGRRFSLEAGRARRGRDARADDALAASTALIRWALIDLALVAEELGCADELATLRRPSGARHEVGRSGERAPSAATSLRRPRSSTRSATLELEAIARLRARAQLVAEGRRAEADEQLQRALAFYRSVGATRYVRQARGAPRRRRQRFPRSACSRSIASKSDLKLPIPKPREPWRSITSKKSVGRSWTIFVKSWSR